MELRDEAGTVFLVSHSLGVVRMTCNRAIWLEKGKVDMDGEANDVVDAYEAMYDPEQEALERKRTRARRRRQRGGLTKAERRAARAAETEAELTGGPDDQPRDGEPTTTSALAPEAPGPESGTPRPEQATGLKSAARPPIATRAG